MNYAGVSVRGQPQPLPCARSLALGLPNRKTMLTEMGMGDVPIWGLISEDVLTNEAAIDAEYKDDGEEH